MSPFSPFATNLAAKMAAKLAAVPVREHTLVVGGAATRYWEYGDANATQSIVMIHGFRGDHHGLEPIVAELGDDVRVIIPDLPGFGASDALPGISDIGAYQRWLGEFFAAVGESASTSHAGVPVILGHSFGSIVVAAALAEGLAAPHAIFINPIAANALQGPNAFMTRLAVLYYKAAAALPEKAGFALLKNKAIVRIMSNTMAKTPDPELRTWIHAQHDAYFSDFVSRASVLEAFETSVGNDVSQFVDAINARSHPVKFLLLVADRDDITALPEQKLLAARLAGAQLEIVTGVGHLVHYEAPDFAARNIRSFMGLSTHS